MNAAPGYEPLANALQEALDQAQHGKGKKCHANGKPFMEQPIMTGGRECGPGGLAFQARKKILEALNCTDADRAIEDFLGAINYTAALVLLRREQCAKEAPKVCDATLRKTAPGQSEYTMAGRMPDYEGLFIPSNDPLGQTVPSGPCRHRNTKNIPPYGNYGFPLLCMDCGTLLYRES